jgi:hypothetical protein
MEINKSASTSRNHSAATLVSHFVFCSSLPISSSCATLVVRVVVEGVDDELLV